MFTQCPECRTVYSLSPADLSAADGFVRCGQCDTTFNALTDLHDSPPPRASSPPADSASRATADKKTDEATYDEQVSASDVESDIDDALSQTVADESANTLADITSSPDSSTDSVAPNLDAGFVDDVDAFEHQVDVLAEIDDQVDVEETPIVDDTVESDDSVEAEDSVEPEDAGEPQEPAIPEPSAEPNDSDSDEAAPTAPEEPVPPKSHIHFRDVLLDDTLDTPDGQTTETPGEKDRPPQEQVADTTDDALIDAPPPASSDAIDMDDQADREDLLDYLRPGLKPWQKIAGTLSALLLLITLGGQAVHHWRSELVLDERYGPMVQKLYDRLGKPVQPAVGFRDYDIVRHTAVAREDDPTILQLRASVTNRASGPRPLPYVRVTFYDRFGDENLVRTFSPREYTQDDQGPRINSSERVEVVLDLANVEADKATNYLVEACAPLGADRVSCGATTTGRRDNR